MLFKDQSLILSIVSKSLIKTIVKVFAIKVFNFFINFFFISMPINYKILSIFLNSLQMFIGQVRLQRKKKTNLPDQNTLLETQQTIPVLHEQGVTGRLQMKQQTAKLRGRTPSLLD